VRFPTLVSTLLAAAALTAAALATPAAAAPLNTSGGTWSGYVASGSQFTSIAASWVVPGNLSCTSADDETDPWVGFDGNGAGPIEQTGLQVLCPGLVPIIHGWFRMNPQAPVYYSNPISPGDAFHASVTRSGANYTMTLTDNTKGWTQTNTRMWSTVNHISAEAILEAPGSKSVRFTSFTFAAVTINGQPLAATNPVALDATNGGFVETHTGPISGGNSFAVTYEHE
jgi:hypothetical protein